MFTLAAPFAPPLQAIFVCEAGVSNIEITFPDKFTSWLVAPVEIIDKVPEIAPEVDELVNLT